MTYDPNGDVLYMVDGRESNSLFAVNRSTGAATLVGSHGISDMFGLSYDSTNDVLYGNTGPGVIYTLNVATGAATLVGASGQTIASL